MATLEKIRKRGFIIASVIGLALLAFILGDLLDSSKSFFGSQKTDVGEVNGNSISIQELELKINEISEIYKLNSGKENLDEATLDGIRDQSWNDLINESIYGREYQKLGVVVSSDELFDQIQGSEPHAIVKQIFTQNGELNKTQLIQFLKGTNDPNQMNDQRKFRLFLEAEVSKDRINAKYFSLIKKGLTTPKFMAVAADNDMNKKADFSYIQIPYVSIDDKSIKIEESDIETYYKKHKYEYNQENTTRDIEYVTFDVKPSKEDFNNATTWINKIKPDFTSTTEVEQFVNGNSDVPYIDKNYKQTDLTDSVGSVMFRATVGDIYGPYFSEGAYKIARLYKIVNIPDSVKARHILIAPKGQTKADFDIAKNQADSIKKLIEKGSDFNALAANFSADKSNAQKGGDLGWFKEGTMVKPFNDGAFNSKKGEVVVVETQYGVHVLQVTDRGKEVKKVKVAFIERKVEASSQTYQQIYSQAMKFAGENQTIELFNTAIAKLKLQKKQAYGLTDMEKKIVGIEQARQVVKWANNAEKGKISEPIDLGSQYVVAALININEKGTLPIEKVKSVIEEKVKNEKKAAVIIEKINKEMASCKSIDELASKMASQVRMANGISFSSYAIPGAGYEPKVTSAAAYIPKMKFSKPIEGNQGVFVIYVTNTTEPDKNANLLEAKMRLDYMLANSINYTVFDALKNLAKVEDTRSLFY